MARPKKADTPPADGRTAYQLDEHKAESLRAAMEAEDDGTELQFFWERMAGELGFVPGSAIIATMADDGPIDITAIAASIVEPDADEEEAEGFDYGAQHTAGIEQITQAVDDFAPATATLAGDLTELLLEIIKRQQRPWGATSQDEKRDLVATLDTLAAQIIGKTVDAVRAEGSVTVAAMVDKIAIGDKVMATLKILSTDEEGMSEAISRLHHCHKKKVLIVTSDTNGFMSRRRELVEPDEEELPFDAGRDDEDYDDDGNLRAGVDNESGDDPE